MLTSPAPGRKDIDDLLAFLPAFEDPNRDWVEKWMPDAADYSPEAQTLVFPYPVYCEDVLAFFALAGQPCWSDYEYEPKRSGEMLEDDEAIRTADLQQLKSMLTYCVRGERFCDGHWGSLLRSGRIVALLRRLAELRGQVEGRTLGGNSLHAPR